MRKYGFSALVAAGLLAGGLTASSASAADLGGNCCADLEERIAELEATTARKGNRKVSLTISGWVAEQVMWWDDGVERNVYVVGLGTTLGSHFKMTGAAQISPGWSAGYVLHVEVDGADSLIQNQGPALATGPGLYPTVFGGSPQRNYVQALQSFWFLKSDHLGKVSVGLQSQASDNTAILVDGSGSLVPANWVLFDVNSFRTRFSSTGAFGPNLNFFGGCHGMGGAAGDCNGLTQNAVRYDSPTFAGFSVSASWGQDDFWDVAARYAGEWHGFKLAVAAAYNEVTDANMGATSGVNISLTVLETPVSSTTIGIPGGFPNVAERNVDLDYFQIGGYVEHVATGLWVYGAYGRLKTDDKDFVPFAFNNPPGPGNAFFSGNGFAPDRTESTTWYGKAGLRERWHPLGHTVIYGEYMQTTVDNNRTGGADIDIGILDYDPYPALARVTATGTGCSGSAEFVTLTNLFDASGYCVLDQDTKLTMWGVGVVQEIDAAAMSIWLKYRQFSPEIENSGNHHTQLACGGSLNVTYDHDVTSVKQGCGLEDFQEFTLGALINF